MHKTLLFAVVAVVAFGCQRASAQFGYVYQECPEVVTSGGSLGGRVAQEYQNTPLYTDANVYTTYEGGVGIPVPSFGFARAGLPVLGGRFGGVGFGGGLAARWAQRRYQSQVNPYEGINPYQGNPLDGNTVTRGPRDFFMTNPPNIGP
ncbi:MAG: hypothetical protein IIZ25_01940 [Thermoguttaceae bacterium]|nr:hypothetical protein [Thermoguttaceae bacterium]